MQPINSTTIFEKDILKPFNDELTVTISNTKKQSKELERQVKLYAKLAEAAGKTAKAYAQIEAANRKQKAALSEKEKFDKKIITLEHRLVEVTDERRKKLEALRIEEQRRNKEARFAAREAAGQVGAFEKLTISIKQLTDKYRDLIAQEGRETAQSRNLREEILALNRLRDQADEAIGRHQNKVGQYGQAISKLTSLMGQLGLAFGVFQLLRSSFTILTDFDEKLADIAKTTGLTIDGARELSLGLLEIDTRSSVTELQELASAAGRLNIKGTKDITEFVEAADKVFVALGDDLEGTAEEIATSLGKISSSFGLEAEFGVAGGIERVGSVMNELAANSKANAGAIFDFTNRMTGLASVAGIAQEDIQALGALFDSTGQSIEVAATTLNTLLPELSKDQERFAEVAGLTAEEFGQMLKNAPIEALKAVAVGAQSSKGGLDGLVESLGDFGVDASRATGIVGVLASNTEELTRLQNLANEASRENVSITNEAALKNDTLNANIEKLKKKWAELVLEWTNGEGVGESLNNVIKFLTNNLETIIKVVIAGVKAWASYKLALSLYRKEIDATGQSVAVGLIPSILNIGKSMIAAARGVNGAALSMRGLGAAMKTIPFAAFVSFLVTVGPMIWDFAAGLFESEEANSALAKATEEANKQITEEKGKMDTLFQQLKRTNSGSFERKKIIDEINGTYGTTLKNLSDEEAFTNQVTAAYNALNKQMEKRIRGQVYQQTLTDLITREIELQQVIDENSGSMISGALADEARKELRQIQEDKDKVFQAISDLGANVEMGKTAAKPKDQRDETIEQQEKTVSIVKDQTTAVKELTAAEEEELLQLKARQQLAEDVAETEKENADILAQNAKDRADEIERINALQEQSDLARLDGYKKEEERIQELYKTIRSEIDETNKLETDALQRQIDGIDLEIEKQKQLYDDAKSREQELKEIAKEGNIDASESIKFEREAQKKAIKEQQDLIRKKQKIEALIAFLNAYAAKISQGDGNPLANIKADILNAKSFVEGEFHKGTDTTIADALGYKSGRDSHVIAIDNDEAVLNSKLTRDMGIGRGRTTQDVADIVKRFDSASQNAITLKDTNPIIINKFDSKALRLLEKMAENTEPKNIGQEKNQFDLITGVLSYQSRSKGRKETVKYRVRK